MLKSVVTSSVMCLSLLSTYASAYSLVSTKTHSGVISSVNQAEKSITITTSNNQEKTFYLSQHAKITTAGGKDFAFNTLQKGQMVKLKQNIETPMTAELKGEVLSIDPATNAVKLQSESTKEIMNVKFDGNTRFSGGEVGSLDAVKKGSNLKVTNVSR